MAKSDTCALRLKKIMEIRGVGITELARRIGRSPGAVWVWVADGSTRLPNVESRRKLADALGCTVDWLVYGRGPEPEPGAAGAPKKDAASGAPSVPEALRAYRMALAEANGWELDGIRIKTEYLEPVDALA